MNNISKVNYFFYEELGKIDTKLADDFLVDISTIKSPIKQFKKGASLNSIHNINNVMNNTNIGIIKNIKRSISSDSYEYSDTISSPISRYTSSYQNSPINGCINLVNSPINACINRNSPISNNSPIHAKRNQIKTNNKHSNSLEDDVLNKMVIEEQKNKYSLKPLFNMFNKIDKYKSMIYTDVANNVPKEIKKIILLKD